MVELPTSYMHVSFLISLISSAACLIEISCIDYGFALILLAMPIKVSHLVFCFSGAVNYIQVSNPGQTLLLFKAMARAEVTGVPPQKDATDFSIY